MFDVCYLDSKGIKTACNFWFSRCLPLHSDTLRQRLEPDRGAGARWVCVPGMQECVLSAQMYSETFPAGGPQDSSGTCSGLRTPWEENVFDVVVSPAIVTLEPTEKQLCLLSLSCLNALVKQTSPGPAACLVLSDPLFLAAALVMFRWYRCHIQRRDRSGARGLPVSVVARLLLSQTLPDGWG